MAATLEQVQQMTERKTTAGEPAHETSGFGVPKTLSPHHFIVEVPRGNSQPILITEDLGNPSSSTDCDVLDRVVLPRTHWTEIRGPVKRTFNERLKVHGLATSQWKVGTNPVDRMLGKELCVLAWGIELLELERVPYALRNWLGLRPEERWWLFDMVAATVGGPEGKGRGWRMALHYALGDTPETAIRNARQSGRHKPNDAGQDTLALFDGDND